MASLAPTPLQPLPKGPRKTGREGLGPTQSRGPAGVEATPGTVS